MNEPRHMNRINDKREDAGSTRPLGSATASLAEQPDSKTCIALSLLYTEHASCSTLTTNAPTVVHLCRRRPPQLWGFPLCRMG